MSKTVLTDLNFNQNEIQNAITQNLAVAPNNPKEGQHYWNTSTKKLMYFNGSEWIDATNQGKIYTFSDGLTLNNQTNNVTLDKATINAIGGVVVGDNINVANTGKISVNNATNSQKGVIQIATDSDISTGTATDKAVTPKQLADTYIPLSQKGANNGVATLGNDGKVPAGQLPSFVDDVIDAYIVGSVALASDWLSLTSGGSALTPEVGKIYVILTSGEYLNKTYRWSGSTYVEISASPAQATESTAGIAKIATENQAKALTDDTTIVTPLKLGAVLTQEAGTTRTLTNKTINADNNTISNIAVSNFKSDVVQTSIREVSSATDTNLATEKAIATALTYKTNKLVATNPELTAVGGTVTWTISNTLATGDVVVMVKEISTNNEVICDITASDSNIVIKMNTGGNLLTGVYKAIIIG